MEKQAKLACVVIDDEPIALRIIGSYIDKIDNLEALGYFTNALDALKVIRDNAIDIIFLDIEMPGINGLNFLKSISNPPRVIFTTAYRNYAADAFDVDALDYLVKPFPFDRFLKSINKYHESIKNSNAALPEIDRRYILLKSDKKNFKIDIDDIIYIESLDDYIKVHTLQKSLVCYLRLSGIESMLESSQFLRIHRAYIINTKHIKAFTHAYVEINQKQIPIGRSYRDRVVRHLGQPK